MIRGLTWKRKNQLLLIGAVLLLWVVYNFALSRTLETRAACIVLQQRIDSAGTAPDQLAALKREFANFQTETGVEDTSDELHEYLLGIVTTYCAANNLVLRNFTQPIHLRQQEWKIDDHPLTIQGSFIGLLKLLHHLEQEPRSSVISSEFRSRRDPKTQELSLSLVLYIQTIQKVRS
jgi:hypothetical protein